MVAEKSTVTTWKYSFICEVVQVFYVELAEFFFPNGGSNHVNSPNRHIWLSKFEHVRNFIFSSKTTPKYDAHWI